MRLAWFHCGTLRAFQSSGFVNTYVNKLAKIEVRCHSILKKLFSIIKCFKNLSAIATKEKDLLIRFYMSERGNKTKQYYAAHQTMHIPSTLNREKKSNKAGFSLMKQRSKIVGDTAQIFRFNHPRLSLGGLCIQTGQLSRILVYKYTQK